MRQIEQGAFTRPGQEHVGRQDAVLGMPRPHEGFGSYEVAVFQVDRRLIPDFEPIFRQDLLQTDLNHALGIATQAKLREGAAQGIALQRFVHHREHLQPAPLAVAPDLLDQHRAEPGQNLDRAEDPGGRQPFDHLERVRRIDRDVDQDEIGPAPVRSRHHFVQRVENLDTDAACLDQRADKPAHAGLAIDEVAQRMFVR
jgi:hypothetical protein